jgi:hypothetical protein
LEAKNWTQKGGTFLLFLRLLCFLLFTVADLIMFHMDFWLLELATYYWAFLLFWIPVGCVESVTADF